MMSQESKKSVFPPGVAVELHRLLDQRADAISELRLLPRYSGYDDFEKREYEDQQKTLQDAISAIEADITKLANRYGKFDSIEAIMEELPLWNEVKMITLVNAKGAPVQ